MPFRAWGHVPKLVVIATAILAFGYLTKQVILTEASVTERQARAFDYAHGYRKRADARIERACVDADPVARQECVAEAIQASEEAQRSEYDLAAQQDTAQWARLAVYAGIASIVVGGVGIYFVRLSLLQGQRGVEAAEAAIADNRDLAQRELRAYVAESSVEWKSDDIFGRNPKITQVFRNSGQTPARSVKVRLHAYLLMNDQEVFTIVDSDLVQNLYGPFDIGASDNYTMQINIMNESVTTIQAAAGAGTGTFIVESKLSYSDVFDRRHETSVTRHAEPRTLLQSHVIQLVLYPTGNSAT